ncbi:MAG: phosphatase PAP2 family protein [Sphingorhabdus sp.]|uniref:phosphatase PAP2 family protein n=1 Tax=Sphingorhabdus sp. TaxID=1902408 RepID=UPI00273D0731|nr:phosphatase PAP2 family protein [Sphingorhabdus sp.]MDP4757456.1 phosphatase PAP2 family protein [Sphingorhabdus sp.]MDP4871967.1 phosphatase PAP2 family protein [Sphingorhabdus sp.]MDP4926157.1 phosphatase PAP2 family protein [Sphingorhabdus sp.]
MTLSARLFLTALLLFAAVIALGFAVTAGRFHDFDIAVSHALNLQRGVSHDWLILVMQGISWIGGGIQRYVIVGILALALWRWSGRGAALAMAVATLASALTSDILKSFFARARPDLVPQLDLISSPAFPSGHATNAAVVYLLFIMLVPQARHPAWRLAAAAMILLMGLSRILLNVHWPTDVIGGWMLGASFALMAAAVISFRREQRQSKDPTVQKF